MNTFLPYKDYGKCAQVLDRQRLGKQRVECLQILRVLAGLTDGWKNHPAVKMWKGYELSLVQYGLTMCTEWFFRGYIDNTGKVISELRVDFIGKSSLITPSWITPEFCLAHQSNLIRKFPEHYRPIFGAHVPDNLPYIWPGNTGH